MTPNRDLPPIHDSSAYDRDESNRSVCSIAEDFAALVDILDRQLKLIPASDRETRTHVLRAKEAAERGVRLSRELLERTQSAK